jgi:hypothetical protein
LNSFRGQSPRSGYQPILQPDIIQFIGGSTLLAKVFDYIVPISLVSDVAEVISAYIQGDRSKLKWSIDFAIHPANQ